MSDPGPDHHPTVAFSVAAFLVIVEGRSDRIAVLLSTLYADRGLSRDSWSVSHTAANRPEFIRRLRASGDAHRRLGMSAHTETTVDFIKRRAATLGLKIVSLRTHS
jgi:hypothetical protein